MNKINVNLDVPCPISEEVIKNIGQFVLRQREKDGLEITINIVTSDVVKKLNTEFMGLNKSTDILSFADPEAGLYEIYIDPSVVGDNARAYEENFETEMKRMIIHGLLHLLGYDHNSHFEGNYKKALLTDDHMFKLQEDLLQQYEEHAKN